MCGIFCTERAVDEAFRVLSSMHYRGPDARRVVRHGGFSMGLTRLSIVDTHAPEAEQPYLTPHGNLIVFNGEVYNYRVLDARAKSEVALLGAMIDERLDLRQYLDGDYAVAHFNPSVQKLILYRDRFGVCPLYYQLHPVVEVSSEARRLQRPREVPAHGRVEIDVRKRRVTRRDVLPLYGATGELHNVRTLVPALFHAVKTRALHTESSFSVATSGGLDSSLVLLALTHQGILPSECLVSYFSPESDDLHCARSLTEHLGLPLKELAIDSRLTSASPQSAAVIEHLDQPHAPATPMRFRGALRSWVVAKHSSTRVVLGGDGGDELLGGYPCHEPSRFGMVEYRVARKRLSTLRSMQHFNLDRTNKMGMAHSREFRSPLLASSFSQLLLSSRWEPGKDSLRHLAKYLGAPVEIIRRAEKYSADELAITGTPA